MTTNRLRRGSALLIVLGMMSFMLFSGLAFAVYMRYSRLPTSFLRRTTTTRQLAKAALAEAIEEIDTAIGNDPHPGIHSGTYASGVAANTWRHRIFFGSDLTGKTEKSITPSPYAPSVLTLEGLAYLPPNLINDVRYYSRCTPTADWQPFWFDSGRYAYVAVDVSDYFDVNRLLANERRAASSSQRITLAHLFEKVGGDSEHTGAGSGADAWDQFINETCGDSEPFVSLADFNIAWGTGSKTFGGQSVANPFRQFVNKGYAYGEDVTAADPKAEYYRQLTFVTDSWSPTPKRTDGITVADLEDPTYQPFKRSDLESTSGKDIGTISDGIGSSKLLNDEKYLGQKLCDLSCYALWDYLDENKQPVSLALPTCEQVPMVCAIQPEFNGSFSFTKEDGPDEVLTESKTSKIVQRDVTYSIVLKDVGSDMNVFASWAYPFLSRGSGEKGGSGGDFKFALDGRVALFLSAEGADVSARPKGEVAGLYFKDKGEMQKGDVVNDSVLTYPLKSKELTLSSDKTVPVKEEQFTVAKGDNSEASNARKLLTITYKWDKKKSDNPNYTDASQAIAIKQPDDGAKFGFFQGKDGGLVLNKEFGLDSIKAGIKLDVNAAVWMRVTDGSDKTFDLVPAGIADDKQFLGVNNSDMRSYYEKADSGGTHPLLSVKASQPITISLETLNDSKGSSYALTGKTLMTGDPRFNHAPENWKITTSGGTDTKTMWYNAEKKEAEKDGCDGDIYMATSDQGYMQSVYELMMLPRIQTAGIKKAGIGDGFKGGYNTTFDGKIRSETETLKDRAFMWRTYRSEDFDEIDDGRIVSGDSGPKVNPYSDSTNVLMAAFANTPHDWRVASTNNDDTMSMEPSKFNETHAWNNYSTTTGGKLCWGCLSEVAGAFSQKARASGDWETAFRELDWNDTGASEEKKRSQMLAGVELDDDDGPLYSVDKKFLYGFWHDSFSARQQLFLVFVRAEPMMMGGGVAGQAPPQLGARAVALVWREPSAFADAAKTPREDAKNSTVHRTRVLFYHQFD